MKINCEYCDATGQVICPECDGEGVCDVDLLDMNDTERSKEFSEIQEHARRVQMQHDELCKLKPEKKAEYDSQLSKVLRELEKEAEDFL